MPREDRKRSVAMVTYPGAALLDLVAAHTVLDGGTGYRTVSVGERTEPLGSDTPMSSPQRRDECAAKGKNTAMMTRPDSGERGSYGNADETHTKKPNFAEGARCELQPLIS
jgi:hypothetical protein